MAKHNVVLRAAVYAYAEYTVNMECGNIGIAKLCAKFGKGSRIIYYYVLSCECSRFFCNEFSVLRYAVYEVAQFKFAHHGNAAAERILCEARIFKRNVNRRSCVYCAYTVAHACTVSAVYKLLPERAFFIGCV